LTTPQIIFEGSQLELNINTSAAGSAYVELQDEAGQPIPGYTLEDADKIMTNDVHYIATWNGNADVSKLAGQPIRLHFQMRSTKLYAFQFFTAEAQ